MAIPGLSAVIIARDAADRLPSCIRALAFADEILVYDGGSADATTQIAETLGARVAVDRDWQGFGRARQRAQDEARHEWILMVDSDERVSAALAQEIGAAIDAGDPCTAYALARRTWVFGRYLAHGGWWPDRVTRLYHREHGRYDDALVHEKVLLAPGTRLARFASPLLHHSYRDMHEYLTKSADYAAAWAKTRELAGRDVSLAAGLAHGAGCFLRMYVLRAGFLDGRAGFLLALLSAHSTFVKYADLWLRSHDPGPPETSA